MRLTIFAFVMMASLVAVSNNLYAQPESWPVKLNKGLFGLAKPDFGPYKTVSIAKIDSATKRSKTTSEVDVSGNGSSGSGNVDISKITTSNVFKLYELVLQDTGMFSIQFAVEELSKEKHETVAGKMFGKQDGSNDETLYRQRNLTGQVFAGESIASFYLHGLSFPSPQLPPGFLSIPLLDNAVIYVGSDSFLVKNTGSMQATVFNAKNLPVASISFQSRKPVVTIDPSATPFQQRCIAAFFAAIISVKDY